MGNNELSGPLVLANLMKLIGRRNNYYSYRFILIPETIGSIAYISKNYKKLRQNVVMGFCLTCLGGDGKHSFVPDRNEGSYVNYLLKDLFQTNKINFKKYSWLDRGSDERQFCSPLVNIPFATIFKTKFGEYEEYHTSLDNKKFLNFSDLKESLKLMNNLVKKIEKKRFPIQKFPCEPFLTKYKLHNPINFKNNSFNRDIFNVLSFCDGKNDIEVNVVKLSLYRNLVSYSWVNKILKLKINKEIKKFRNKNVVIACSALKEIYRKRLVKGIEAKIDWFCLKGTFDIIKERLDNRGDHYFKSTLLRSQFNIIEYPDYCTFIDIIESPDKIIERIKSAL